jgi:hypothetical protein
MAPTATRPEKEHSVSLIQVKAIEGVFTAPQKRELVERPTDAMVQEARRGRSELASHAALVLADPPEAGWRMETRSNERATADAELLAAPVSPSHTSEPSVTTCTQRRARRPRTPEQQEQRQPPTESEQR